MRQFSAGCALFFLRIMNGRMIALCAMSLVLSFLIVSCRKNETEAAKLTDSYLNELKELTTRYEKGDTTALDALARMMQDCPDRNTCKDMAYNLYLIAERNSKAEFHNLAIELYNAGKIAAEKSEDEEIRTTFYAQLAYNYYKTDKEDSLYHYLHLVENFPSDHLSTISASIYLFTKASLAEDQNKYLEAIEYYWRAYTFVRGQQSVNEAVIMENIGVLYITLKHYNRSLHYLKQSLPIYQKSGDTAHLIRLYSNLGVVYRNMDSLSLAASMQTKSIELAEKNSFAHARGLANYGKVLLSMGKYEQALNAIDSSTAICQRLGILYGIFVNKINLSHILLDMKKASEALKILDEVQSSPFLTDINLQIEVSENILRAYEQLNDIPQIIVYQKKIIKLKNVLFDSGEVRMALEWEERFINQLKEQELAERNHELNISRQQLKLGLLGGLFALITFLFIIRLFYLRTQRQQLRSKLLEEEGEIFRLQLELKERALTSQAIHLQSIGGFADNIITKLIQVRNKMKGDLAEELSRVIKDFENGIPEELWDDFRLRFEKINEGFHQNLLNIAPDLTPAEIKIASFLRLNLSSKEISRLTNRSAGTISNTRSSLRKKLNLEEEDNLVAFLMSL